MNKPEIIFELSGGEPPIKISHFPAIIGRRDFRSWFQSHRDEIMRVSREHLQLIFDDGEFYLENFKTPSATRVADRDVESRVRLVGENKLTLGHKLTFTLWCSAPDPVETQVCKNSPDPMMQTCVETPAEADRRIRESGRFVRNPPGGATSPLTRNQFEEQKTLSSIELSNDFKQHINEQLAREEAERLAREEAERQAREEAERQAREEAERLAREEAERQAREEAERLAREEAERLVREEAERLAREEAERLAREEAERLAREDITQIRNQITAIQQRAEEEIRRLQEAEHHAENLEALLRGNNAN